jgi:hypothetical protein
MTVVTRVSGNSIAFAGCTPNQIKEIIYMIAVIEPNLYVFHPLPDGVSFSVSNINKVNQILEKINWKNYNFKSDKNVKEIELNF